MMNAFLEAALQYAELGYAVLPCRPGDKPPLTSNGLKAATTDPDQIERWWSKWPDANVAIRTDGLLVIDVDTPDGTSIGWLTAVLCRGRSSWAP